MTRQTAIALCVIAFMVGVLYGRWIDRSTSDRIIDMWSRVADERREALKDCLAQLQTTRDAIR